ncbi:hypothetical protein RI367_003723 [Sorochytrium milnesiophthora]
METSLDQVQRYCPDELRAYQKCLEKNSGAGKNMGDAAAKCQTLKVTLGRCCDEKIPIVKAIKQRCTPHIQEYARCVEAHDDDPTKCIEQLRSFYSCTQTAQQEFQQKAQQK